MGVEISLDNSILFNAHKENQLVQLKSLAKQLSSVDDKDRFLVDTFYTRLSEYANDTANYIDNIDEEANTLFKMCPMYSIQTATSYESDVLRMFVSRLQDNKSFIGHLSVKLNGWYIRLVYKYGEFYRAFTKNGRDLTNQLIPFLEKTNCLLIEDFEMLEWVEVRGELVINKDNLENVREVTNSKVSIYTGVGWLCNSEDENVWSLLNFIAFNLIADGVTFSTKTEEYQYLEELGYEVPMYWIVEDLKKETFIDDLHSIVEDCEIEVRATDVQEGYSYLTDGLIFSIDDRNYFNKLGKSVSQYQYGNINLRIGYWHQKTYQGYIQTIYWKQERDYLKPYAIIADSPNIIEFDDFGMNYYVTRIESITNMDKLGVHTENGKVTLVPLYNPNQILRLDTYVETQIIFVEDKILGVLPCYDDGRVLLDGLLQEVISGEKQFS